MTIYAHAIADLQIKLENAEANAPIYKAAGNKEQAKLCRDTAASCRAAIKALEAAS